jgi:hypothetical protein
MDLAIHRANVPPRACRLIRWEARVGHPTRLSGKHNGGHVETGNDPETLSNSDGLRGG